MYRACGASPLKEVIMKRTVAVLIAMLAVAGAAGVALAQSGSPPAMSKEEFDQAKKIFFDRCAGCHGVLRKGATDRSCSQGTCRRKGRRSSRRSSSRVR
jgi:mono/diheme cytochrome c family protein